MNVSVSHAGTFLSRTRLNLLTGLAALLTCVGASTLLAQPSGGPYGPQRQVYEVPKDARTVYYVSPDGRADAAGTSLEQPTTLAVAISKVVTGDAIILRGGTYRTGSLKLNQGITLQPYRDELPILKGTEVADKWEALRIGWEDASEPRLWRTTWTKFFPAKPADWWRRQRHGAETAPWRFNNDMVFVDGRMLQAVGWEGEVDENSYTIDYETGTVYIGVNPADKQVEITTHDAAIVRTTADVHGKTSDKKGFIMRGLTLTQYAYRALEIEGHEPEKLADPSTFGKDVVGTTLEHVTITHCSRVGGYFRGDNMVFRNCLVSDTSTEGIYIISSGDVLLEKNIIRRNNVENIAGYYPAAVKIFNQSYRAVVRDNLVLDNANSSGIWWDVGNVDAVFVNNWIQNTSDGFFFEISKGAICAGNVFVDCNKGIRILNSSGVEVYNNTFVNSVAWFERNERSAVGDHFGWHPSTGPDVHERVNHVFVNNLMVGDDTFRGPLLQVEQSKALCGKQTAPQLKQVESNVYVRRGQPVKDPLIAWGPVEGPDCKATYASLEGLQKLPGKYETQGRFFAAYPGSVFRSHDLGNYELLEGFPGVGSLTALPAPVAKVVGWPAQPSMPGAYPKKK